MGENELAKLTMKVVYSIGLGLHILSIICRWFLLTNGPAQLAALAPYLIMETLFLYNSCKATYVDSSLFDSIWMKVFSGINVILFTSLFTASIFLDIAFNGKSGKGEETTIIGMLMLLWIIFLSGPLISNAAFLGSSYLSKQVVTKVTEATFDVKLCSEDKQRRLSETEVSIGSTEAPTNISVL